MEERQQFSKIDKLIAQIDMAVFLVKHSRLKNLESFDCDTSETWREFLKKVSQLETDVKQLTYTINQEKEV